MEFLQNPSRGDSRIARNIEQFCKMKYGSHITSKRAIRESPLRVVLCGVVRFRKRSKIRIYVSS